ncbi:DnaB-like helicase N-terminal domain-containing protein [Streptomyces sp. NPDC050485]|uniref:DnaB-like helicase N-terminal domain-containing protein n=1 Tax=Streptomyces sp. NPDC050485 TaxID=3365617 RepID=UPI0037A88EFF
MPPTPENFDVDVIAPRHLAGGDEEAVDEERLLLATATAYPNGIEQMRWLTPGDFTHPLYAGLWRCLNTLPRRGTPLDPVTVPAASWTPGLIHESCWTSSPDRSAPRSTGTSASRSAPSSPTPANRPGRTKSARTAGVPRAAPPRTTAPPTARSSR